MDDDRHQLRRHRQPDDVGRIGMPNEHEAAAQRRRDIVRVRRSDTEPLALERTRDQHFERRMRVEKCIDGDQFYDRICDVC